MSNNKILNLLLNKYSLILLIFIFWIMLVILLINSKYINLQFLKDNSIYFVNFVEQYFLYSVLLSCLLFFLVSALALPGGILLTLSLGFLFPPFLACLIAVISGTLGGYIPFILAKKLFLKKVHF